MDALFIDSRESKELYSTVLILVVMDALFIAKYKLEKTSKVMS